MLGHQRGMLAEPVAGAFDLNDDGMVEEAIEERRGDDGIAEDVAPFGKTSVGGEDHGALLVSGVEELEEEIAAPGHDGEIADLVDHKERRTAKEAQTFAKASLPFCLGKARNEFGQGAEVDALSGFYGLDAKSDGQVALAGAGRSEKVDDLAAGDCQTAFKTDPGSASNFDPLGVRAHGRSRRIEAGGEEETGPEFVLAERHVELPGALGSGRPG